MRSKDDEVHDPKCRLWGAKEMARRRRQGVRSGEVAEVRARSFREAKEARRPLQEMADQTEAARQRALKESGYVGRTPKRGASPAVETTTNNTRD